MCSFKLHPGRCLRHLFLITVCFSFCDHASIFAQKGKWKELSDHPGSIHRNAASFQINGRIYYLIAHDSTGCSSNFWEYEPSTDSWTRLNDFPGQITKKDLDGFAIDSIGYVGTGRMCGGGTLGEFWAYDPSNDSWTQKASYPAGGREMTTAFAVQGKGYIGLGRSYYSNNKIDLYAYNPVTDSWSQRSNYPGAGKINCVALTAGGKAYVATGASSSTDGSKELWQYAPKTDQWKQLQDLPGPGRSNASGFEIDGYLYIGGGWNGDDVYSDFYRYDPSTDAWTSIPDKPGQPFRNMEAFSFKGKGYVVGGRNVNYELTDAVHIYKAKDSSKKHIPKKDTAKEHFFTVQPNPSDGRIKIQKLENRKNVEKIRLISPQGEPVQTAPFRNQELKMDLEGFKPGLYFLEVWGAKERVAVKKLILK